MGGRNVGDGYGGDAFELDDDMAVLANALYHALDTGKVSLCHADTDAGTTEVVAAIQEHDTVVLDGGYTDEVGHLLVRHTEYLAGMLVRGLAHHITQGLESTAEHLQFSDAGLRGADEDEIVDGRD